MYTYMPWLELSSYKRRGIGTPCHGMKSLRHVDRRPAVRRRKDIKSSMRWLAQRFYYAIVPRDTNNDLNNVRQICHNSFCELR